MSPLERSADRRQRHDRRQGAERRQTEVPAPHWNEPSWADQQLQFVTRFLFAIVGLLYFNVVFEFERAWLTVMQINVMLCTYFIWLALAYGHAWRVRYSTRRFRLAMWVDVACVSMVVLNDPFVVPITSLVYIVIVLGNGMRYGMKCFSEALIGSLLAAMLTLSVRYLGGVDEVTPGVLFLNLFGAVIVVYAYILMGRVESTRKILEQNSQRDLLTGLLNRGALVDFAARMFDELRGGDRKFVVLFADLDKFKSINDTWGHAEGDRVLAAVGSILSTSVRQSDVAARYGGDEFVLLLRDTTLDYASQVCERISQRIREWGRLCNREVGVTIGMGEAPTHGATLSALLNRVDKALYESKSDPAGSGVQRAVQSP
jgi:diguanylate cyclase (GGDEF)-like protein